MIRAATADALDAKITNSSQTARQADCSSPLIMVSKTTMTLEHEDRDFVFEALVIENLDVEVLAEMSFLETNNITVWLAEHEIILGDGRTHSYGATITQSLHHKVRQAHVLWAPPTTTTVYPGNFLKLPTGIDEGFSPIAVKLNYTIYFKKVSILTKTTQYLHLDLHAKSQLLNIYI